MLGRAGRRKRALRPREGAQGDRGADPQVRSHPRSGCSDRRPAGRSAAGGGDREGSVPRGEHFLILDEPTGVLTPQESVELFGKAARPGQKRQDDHLHQPQAARRPSRSRTASQSCDGARWPGTSSPKRPNEQEIATLMVGREVLLRVDKKPAKPGAVAFRVENLTASSDRGVPALRGVSFELRAGENSSASPLQAEGNGQSELVEVLAGTRRATGGRILLGDRDVTAFDARMERDSGIAHIPEDRRGTGLVLGYSIADNLVLGRQRAPEFSWHAMLLRIAAIRDWAKRLVKEFDIRAPNIEVAARTLSWRQPAEDHRCAREMASRPPGAAGRPTHSRSRHRRHRVHPPPDRRRARRRHRRAAGFRGAGGDSIAVGSDRGPLRGRYRQHRVLADTPGGAAWAPHDRAAAQVPAPGLPSHHPSNREAGAAPAIASRRSCSSCRGNRVLGHVLVVPAVTS